MPMDCQALYLFGLALMQFPQFCYEVQVIYQALKNVNEVDYTGEVKFQILNKLKKSKLIMLYSAKKKDNAI